MLCNLTCEFNWLSQGSVIWSGHYKCTFKKCGVKFKIEAVGFNNQSVTFKAIINGNRNHDHKIPIIRRISGDERKKLAIELRANGVTNVRNSNIISNKLLSDPRNIKLEETFLVE